jgi:hypothetical protein
MRASLLFAAFLAAPAAARSWPDCLHQGAKKTPPSSLAELRACQKKSAQKLLARAEAKGKPLSDADRDALAEHQRAEARKFLASGVVTDDSATAAESKENRPGAGPEAPDPSDPDHELAVRASSAKIQARFAAAGVQHVSQDTIDQLTSALQSTGGRITPAIDAMVVQAIAAEKSASADGGADAGQGAGAGAGAPSDNGDAPSR